MIIEKIHVIYSKACQSVLEMGEKVFVVGITVSMSSLTAGSDYYSETVSLTCQAHGFSLPKANTVQVI